MDAYVQVALIEKSKRVFATAAGNFLSFPLLSPLTFKPRELASLSMPASAEDYAAAANFARIVNFMPRDLVASFGDEGYLWDVYADVLTRADVADGSAGQTRQNASSALLYELAPDGSRNESAVYREYRQFRDVWIVAQEDYSTQRSTGEVSEDPEVHQRWTDVVEPALREALAKAEYDWNTLGHRAEVEAALLAERESASNNPRARWQEWANAFNPDIDLMTDTSGRYAPTGLSPKNFVDEAAWLHFELSSAEMASLVSRAPEALKVVLDEQAGSTIERVSFDYRSVALVRPWFQSNALTSRIWRSSDPQLTLSDGGEPASGVCPGYVSAVVFVRNLQVTSRPAAASATATAPVPGDLCFTLPANRLTARNLTTESARSLPRARAVQATVSHPKATVETAFRKLDRQSLVVAKTAPAPATARTALIATAMNPTRVQRASTASLHTLVRTLPGQPQPAPEPVPQPPPQPQPQRSDDIAILAFICKRLPKVPDPMPELRWT